MGVRVPGRLLELRARRAGWTRRVGCWRRRRTRSSGAGEVPAELGGRSVGRSGRRLVLAPGKSSWPRAEAVCETRDGEGVGRTSGRRGERARRGGQRGTTPAATGVASATDGAGEGRESGHRSASRLQRASTAGEPDAHETGRGDDGGSALGERRGRASCGKHRGCGSGSRCVRAGSERRELECGFVSAAEGRWLGTETKLLDQASPSHRPPAVGRDLSHGAPALGEAPLAHRGAAPLPTRPFRSACLSSCAAPSASPLRRPVHRPARRTGSSSFVAPSRQRFSPARPQPRARRLLLLLHSKRRGGFDAQRADVLARWQRGRADAPLPDEEGCSAPPPLADKAARTSFEASSSTSFVLRPDPTRPASSTMPGERYFR